MINYQILHLKKRFFARFLTFLQIPLPFLGIKKQKNVVYSNIFSNFAPTYNKERIYSTTR